MLFSDSFVLAARTVDLDLGLKCESAQILFDARIPLGRPPAAPGFFMPEREI